MCFATSTDGLNFERPSLGLREFGGNHDNNLVSLPKEANEARVFRDNHDPERRHKMVFMKLDAYRISVAWLRDGIQWTEHKFP